MGGQQHTQKHSQASSRRSRRPGSGGGCWESKTSARSRTVGQSPAGHWLEGQPRRRPSCVRGAATGLPGFPAQHPPLPD